MNKIPSEHRHHVGSKVRLLQCHVDFMKKMHNSDTTPGYPCWELIKQAQSVADAEIHGDVIQTCAGRFQVTVKFGPILLHLKSNWVEKVS